MIRVLAWALGVPDWQSEVSLCATQLGQSVGQHSNLKRASFCFGRFFFFFWGVGGGGGLGIISYGALLSTHFKPSITKSNRFSISKFYAI